MKTWVNSRTKTEDYTWRTDAKCGLKDPPASIDDGYEKWKFEDCIPWFGLVASQNEATLYFGNLITSREDSRGRPIFVHAALQAENSKDVLDLVGFVSSLLVHEEELLPKWTAFFSEVFDNGIVGTFPDTSRTIRLASSQDSIGRFVYPRTEAVSRNSIAQRLSSGVNLAVPIAVGTTGRSGKGIFERVCCSGNAWQTAFFSSSCTMKAELQVAMSSTREARVNTRVVAAAIGGAAILAIIAAAIGPCSRSGEEDKTNASTGREVVTTNTPASAGTSNTNLVQVEGRSRELVGEARQNSSSTNAGQPDAETSASAITLPVNKTGVILNKENQ